jgi:TRAP-type C4-dicarboxylate transport system permease small subunit
MKLLKICDKLLSKIEGIFLVLLLSLMVVLTFAQVCLRALYTHAHLEWANVVMGHLDWSESFVRLLVLWLTFLGASLITGEGRHIKIDLFAALIPSQWLPYRELLLSVVCMGITAAMVKVCIDYLRLEMEFGASLFFRVPTWIGQLILPIGFALILFRFLLIAIEQGQQIAKRVAK